ncbi:phage tail tape measure protein [Lacticaseibacillus sp. 866-1]|uniref:phage tail tape measure protein n=1 Tax=Lacticaseibacillus sp. 866-1 TaxID=2799576 RepID=UPI00194359A7|nr:phage tail tape measure protein [Lacticaseibacillus sp. 866-1]
MDGLSKTIGGASDKLKALGGKLTGIGAGMTAGITVPFLGAVKSTAQFEDSMNKVRVTLLGGQKETAAFRQTFSGLQDDALKLAAKFPVNAQEVSDSMLELAKSGQSANNIMDMMPGILSAASASGEDVATTSNTVSAALAGFGLQAKDAGRVADVLTNSANASKAGIADMGEVFKYAAPTAHTLGISMEELSAASGLMMDKGLEASQVGTTLTMAFTRMVKPTKQAQEVMDKLGFSAVDQNGKFKSLTTIVGELNKAMINYTPAQKTAALSTIMGTEAGSKFLMLMDSGAGKIAANTKAISERGTAEKTAAEMQKSLSANIETLGGSFDALTKSIMSQNTPAITALTQKITGLVDGFNNMSDSTKGTIATIAAIAAAIGPVLLVVGPLTSGLGTMGTALAWLVTPAGLVVTALAALAAGFAYMMATNSKFASSVKSVLGSALDIAKGLISSLQAAFTAALPTIQSVVSGMVTGVSNAFAGLKGIFSAAWEIVKSFVSGFLEGFKGLSTGIGGSLSQIIPAMGLLSGPMGLVIGLLKQFGPQIAAVATSVGAQLMPVFSSLGQALGEIVGGVIPPLLAALASIGQIVLQVATQAFGALLPILPQIAGLLGQVAPLFTQLGLIIATVVSQVAPLITQLVSGLSPVITTIFGVIKNVIQALMNLVSAVLPVITTILTTIMNLIQTLIPIVLSIASVVVSIAVPIISAIQPIIALLGTILSGVVNLIAGVIATVTPVIAFIAGVISSIMSVISPIAAFIGGVFSTAVTLITGAFNTAATVIAGFINGAGQVIGGIVKVVTTVSGSIVKVFNSLSSTVSRIFTGIGSAITAVFNGIKAAWGGLTGFVGGIFSGISKAVGKLVSSVKGLVNDVIGGINGAIGLINKIPGVSIGKIPYLARGTDNFQGGAARINEGGRGEMVILPNGSQVIPHDVSMKAARESAVNQTRNFTDSRDAITYNYGDVVLNLSPQMNSEADVEKLSTQLAFLVDRKRRA